MKRLQGSGLLLQRGRYKKRTVTPFWVPPGLQLAERGDSRERPRPCSPSMGTFAHRVGSRLLPGTTLEPGPATTEKPLCPCVAPWLAREQCCTGSLAQGRAAWPHPDTTTGGPGLLPCSAVLPGWGAEVPNCSAALERLLWGPHRAPLGALSTFTQGRREQGHCPLSRRGALQPAPGL